MTFNIGDTVTIIANTGTGDNYNYIGMSGVIIDTECDGLYPFIVHTSGGELIECSKDDIQNDPTE